MNVSWKDAQQYVAWLTNRTGKRYRLLSEAEWEYAARAQSAKAYSWGDDIKNDGETMANCFTCGSEWDNKMTAPVGSFAPNGFGLHDMHGNVWEWVEDCWHANYEGAPSDGSSWTNEAACQSHVTRGGSFDLNPEYLRAASRAEFNADVRGLNLGFRVARPLTR